MIAMKSIILYDFEIQNLQKNGHGQIRRVCKVQPPGDHYKLGRETSGKYDGKMFWYDDDFCCSEHFTCPFGAVGEEILVKETWCKLYEVDVNGYTHYDKSKYYYAADGDYQIDLYDDNGFYLDNQKMPWKSPATMPREASRLTIMVDNIWTERVQDIDGNDLWAEGFGTASEARTPYIYGKAKAEFEFIWDSRAKPGYNWADNPMAFAAEVKAK
jgi:hypothetical protein